MRQPLMFDRQLIVCTATKRSPLSKSIYLTGDIIFYFYSLSKGQARTLVLLELTTGTGSTIHPTEPSKQN